MKFLALSILVAWDLCNLHIFLQFVNVGHNWDIPNFLQLIQQKLDDKIGQLCLLWY